MVPSIQWYFSLVFLPHDIGVAHGVVVVVSGVPSPGGMLSFPVKKKII